VRNAPWIDAVIDGSVPIVWQGQTKGPFRDAASKLTFSRTSQRRAMR